MKRVSLKYILLVSLSILLVGCGCEIYESEPGPLPQGLKNAVNDSDFRLGAVPREKLLNPNSKDRTSDDNDWDERYDLTLRENFNSLMPENELKWFAVAAEADGFDFEAADFLVDYAEDNSMRVRGHALLWHMLLPDYVEEAGEDGRLEQVVTRHIDAVVGRYAGRIDTWDVVLEPLNVFGGTLHENIFYQYLGEEYIDKVFHLAHQADPFAKLYISENFTFLIEKKHKALVALAKRLLNRGVPLHGIALQGHMVPPFFATAYSEDFIVERLQDFADLGLEVEISELDIPFASLYSVTPHATQAIVYGRFVRACKRVSACKGITFFGVSDADTWYDRFDQLTNLEESPIKFDPFSRTRPNRPLLFDAEFQPKQAAHSVYDALLNF